VGMLAVMGLDTNAIISDRSAKVRMQSPMVTELLPLILPLSCP
jgi:hypothetical protein